MNSDRISCIKHVSVMGSRGSIADSGESGESAAGSRESVTGDYEGMKKMAMEKTRCISEVLASARTTWLDQYLKHLIQSSRVLPTSNKLLCWFCNEIQIQAMSEYIYVKFIRVEQNWKTETLNPQKRSRSRLTADLRGVRSSAQSWFSLGRMS